MSDSYILVHCSCTKNASYIISHSTARGSYKANIKIGHIKNYSTQEILSCFLSSILHFTVSSSMWNECATKMKDNALFLIFDCSL